MLDADLAPLALALALRDDGRPGRPRPRRAQEPGPDIGPVPPSWGTLDGRSPGGDLRWLDAPPADALAAARALLRSLGAIDAAGVATPVGVWSWPSRYSGLQVGRRWPGRIPRATIHSPCPCVELWCRWCRLGGSQHPNSLLFFDEHQAGIAPPRYAVILGVRGVTGRRMAGSVWNIGSHVRYVWQAGVWRGWASTHAWRAWCLQHRTPAWAPPAALLRQCWASATPCLAITGWGPA